MGNEGFSIDYFLRHQCKGAMDTHPSFSPHRKDIDSIFKEPEKKINQNLKKLLPDQRFLVDNPDELIDFKLAVGGLKK